MTPAGKLTTLYSFCKAANCPDGDQPSGCWCRPRTATSTGQPGQAASTTVVRLSNSRRRASLQYSISSALKRTALTEATRWQGLAQGTDGSFYGTTYGGGTANNTLCSGCGMAFEIAPGGKLSTLYNFCSRTNCTDGGFATEALMQATNGTFYGLTGKGGADFTGCIAGGGCGDVSVCLWGLVHLSKPTRPPASGEGRHDSGNSLTGATSVNFNGTAATFTVVSGSEIKTTVPMGATTGSVEVTTPKKALREQRPFRVTN